MSGFDGRLYLGKSCFLLMSSWALYLVVLIGSLVSASLAGKVDLES